MNKSELYSNSENSQRFAIIDLETTGLSPDQGDRITEIGIVMLENGQIVDRFQSFINPKRSIPYYVQELTGITDDMVANAPSSSAVLSQAIEFIGEVTLVAHNASFERKFLNSELKKINPKNELHLHCTMLLSRRIFPNLTSFKLGDLVSQFNLPKGQEHRALSDAEMTAHLLKKIIADASAVANSKIEINSNNLFRICSDAPKQYRDKGVGEGIKAAIKYHAKRKFPSNILIVASNKSKKKAPVASISKSTKPSITSNDPPAKKIAVSKKKSRKPKSTIPTVSTSKPAEPLVISNNFPVEKVKSKGNFKALTKAVLLMLNRY